MSVASRHARTAGYIAFGHLVERSFLRPRAATNGDEDRDDAVAQGGIERPCFPGTGEVAGSSPASVTIKERLIDGGTHDCVASKPT
jgi:hypothetical protein